MMLGRVGLYLMTSTLFLPVMSRADEESPNADPWDCGVFALYHLLRLEGRPTDLVRLRPVSGAPTPGGRSFRELRATASRFGLSLDAVALSKTGSAIKGPTLVLVKSRGEGHFIVLRPVGHTGHLIQVLDGERPPIVIDADRLFGSPSWTGLALIPHRSNYLCIAAVGISTGCGIAFAFRRWTRTQGESHLQVSSVATSLPGSFK